MVSSRNVSLCAWAALMVASVAPVSAQSAKSLPEVIQSSRHDVSAPMRDIIRDLPSQPPSGSELEEHEIPNILFKPKGSGAAAIQYPLRLPYIQSVDTGVPAPTIGLSFNGINQSAGCGGCRPPDTEGDVGLNEYIQWVNTKWAVYNKTTGALTSGPTAGNSFWVGFGGLCQTTNAGDPLVLFDQHAQRWVMSQFTTTAPFAQCVAVSTSSDPLGTYARYEFDWPANHFGDYGKIGVWTTDSGGSNQDAYLLTTHEFNAAGTSFFGAAFIAFERDAMLSGAATAKMVRFPGLDAYGVEPVNLIGTLNAPANACPFFVHFDASTSDYKFWDTCLDWTTPANSTVSTNPQLVPGNPFTALADPVVQPGTTSTLDNFSTHVMYHAQARMFPANSGLPMSLVITHTVTGSANQGGVSWVNFKVSNGGSVPALPTGLTKSIANEGVYAPDATTRWMGSIAIEKDGNIGVGYSASSTTVFPQIMMTGRTRDDAPGTMRDEQNCTLGLANGSQTISATRWGDYSAMNVDPTDQCTFWYTSEYFAVTSSTAWSTRVCSFKFPNCGNPDFTVTVDTPPRIEQCNATAGGNPSWTLSAGVLNGYAGSVTLSGSGLPSGSSATFGTNPIAPPGSSTFTLTGGSSLASGEYAFSAIGNDGTNSHSVPLTLGVSQNSAEAPILSTPINTQTSVKVRPKLTWNGADRIFVDGFEGTASPSSTSPSLRYFVQVATDAGFSNVIASATVTTTSWTVNVALNPTTTYYWRVTPHNYCGDGPVSPTFSFTTGTPGTCPSGTSSSTVYSYDFESGANGWTVTGSGGTGWTQGAATSGTGLSTTVWQIPDNGTSTDWTLQSPSIAIPSGAAAVILSYDTFHSLETGDATSCYDNGSLSLAADGSSTFGYLGPERMFTDPYDGVGLSTTALGNSYVWCHPGPTHSIVDLDGYSGHNVRIGFRVASDANSVATAPNGMAIDNFKIEACQ